MAILYCCYCVLLYSFHAAFCGLINSKFKTKNQNRKPNNANSNLAGYTHVGIEQKKHITFSLSFAFVVNKIHLQ